MCTPSALRFLTTEEVTIADGLASVLCVAEDIGADYNVPEATVTQMAVNIHGVHGVTNAAAGVGARTKRATQICGHAITSAAQSRSHPATPTTT